MREARDILVDLVDDMEWFCCRADHLAHCGAAQELIDQVRERLRQVSAELALAPEPPPVPLWPSPSEKC